MLKILIYVCRILDIKDLRVQGGYSLQKMAVLDATGNSLSTLDSDSVLQFPNVTNLNLTDCDLNNIHKDAFKRSRRLRILSLASNRQLDARKLIGSLKQVNRTLRSLDLSDMSEKFDLFTLLSDIGRSGLESLRLVRNGLDYFPRVFFSLTKLKSIDLSENRLTAMPDFSGIQELKFLKLSRNHLRSFSGKDVEHIQYITDLDLSENRLESVSSLALSKLFLLENLDVSYNRITQLNRASSLEHLVRLKADHNSLKSLEFAEKLQNLKYMDVSANRLDFINDLRRILYSCFACP